MKFGWTPEICLDISGVYHHHDNKRGSVLQFESVGQVSCMRWDDRLFGRSEVIRDDDGVIFGTGIVNYAAYGPEGGLKRFRVDLRQLIHSLFLAYPDSSYADDLDIITRRIPPAEAMLLDYVVESNRRFLELRCGKSVGRVGMHDNPFAGADSVIGSVFNSFGEVFMPVTNRKLTIINFWDNVSVVVDGDGGQRIGGAYSVASQVDMESLDHTLKRGIRTFSDARWLMRKALLDMPLE